MDWHALLLLSAAGGTQALRTDEELDELPPAASGLRLDRATLLAGNLLSASRIVQARPSPMQSASISPQAPRQARSCLLLQRTCLLKSVKQQPAAPPQVLRT